MSGTGGGTGGTTAFTSVFTSRTPAGTVTMSNAAVTLTTAQMPSHTHSETGSTGVNQSGGATKAPVLGVPSGTTTGSTGGGGSHTHANTASFSGTALDFNVQFIDIILCSKD